ncbi:hypothetical protein GLYMA_18G270300v4 [Glycine max]|uniref:Uncharacterized protein n=1 Tax=Glycine max TaxID=3847 RepID=I1N4N2_SOYBN|nr:uncharacterized protein LOC100500432 precursor [Glycine max]KAH1156354.1 hypothetical protein GYH30_051245 [Glycine max]KRH01340.1 hypothetical protein GLYMA_18G270300v4 [Glycine max]|eukprot:NP_001237993.2 uncharacterized protein LOC100500432 precursor [Glycine max]
MKKQASTFFLMWLMVISLQTHITIAALSKSNGTISLCDGSVEDCLNVDHLDSQLPTISSSHFRRILLAGQNTGGTPDPNNPAIKCVRIDRYGSCLPQADGKKRHCDITNRGC